MTSSASFFLSFTKISYVLLSFTLFGNISNDFVIYNVDKGELFYDADANGTHEAVQIALIGISLHPDLSAVDFVVI